MVMAAVPMTVMVPGAGELVLGNPRAPEMDRDYSSVPSVVDPIFCNGRGLDTTG